MVFPNINAHTFKSICLYDRKYGLQSQVAKNVIYNNSITEYIKLIKKKDTLINDLGDEYKREIQLKIENEAKTRGLLEYMFSHRRLYRIYKYVLLRIDQYRYVEMFDNTEIKKNYKKKISFGNIEIKEFTD